MGEDWTLGTYRGAQRARVAQ